MKKKFILIIVTLLFVIQGILFAQDPIITITQVDTAFALTGMPLQPVIKIKINNPTASSMTLQKIVVKSLNQDNTDIDSIALFYTVNNRFSIADYPTDIQVKIGNKLKLSGDTVVFSGFSFALDPGDNYIWVMMDVTKLAIPSHTLDASIRAGGIEIDYNFFPASIQSPTGSIPIKSVYYRCNFETFDSNNKPKNWTQAPESGAGSWLGFYGGFGVSTADNIYAPRIHYPDGHPGEPKSGKGNVTLKLQSSTPKTNMLISPAIDLSLATKSHLIFYHSQVQRCKDELCNEVINDELEVYYQVGATNPANWTLLNSYHIGTDNAWYKHDILLPDPTVQKNVYIGFKGTTRNAWGVCLDSMIIHEVGTAARQVKSVDVVRPLSNFIAQGSIKNPILRTNIRVSGNTTAINLTSLTITTKNQNDADIVNGSVRLYTSLDSVFFSPIQIGTSQSITGGKVVFSGLNKTIETGDNYFWVTYDIKTNAFPDDTLAASINANDIILDSGTYPAIAQSPPGSRKIKQAIFFDNFETIKGWDLSVGDFQQRAPKGLGGNKGRPDPLYAYDDTTVLGNDLSGLGSFPGDYEPNSRSLALSPLIPGKYFKNIHLDFSRWLNIENADSACIEFKYTGSNKWDSIWLNNSTIVDTKWQQQSFDLSKKIIRRDFNLRFRLGTTNSLANFSGWNIDYLFITGDSIKYDAAITKILSPSTSCGLTSTEKIKVRIKNTGPKSISSFPIKFSKDGGKTYVTETVLNTIAIGDSLDYLSTTTLDFSKPAVYNVLVKVAVPGDNYPDNDTIKTQIVALPTHHLPYQTGFEEDTVFWTSGGVLPSWKLKSPNNNYIKTPGEGFQSWITEGETGKYNLYENSYVVSPCYIFDTNTLPIVDFNSNYYSVNKYDGAILQYSLNEGATWQYVAKDAYSFNWNWYNDTIKAFKGTPGWTDRSKNLSGNQIWIRQKQVLPAATIGPKVRFRIALKSDSSSTYTADGFAFDDFKLYNAPYDVGVTSIDNLVTPSCQFGSNANPDKLKITVKNFGIRDIQATDSIIIGIKVNNSAIVSEKFILGTNLAVGTDRQFTMTKSINLQAKGNYIIKAFTRNELDPNFYGPGRGAANDTSFISIVVNPNPVAGLVDTVYTNRPQKAKIQAIDSAYFTYNWIYPKTSYFLNGYQPVLQVKNTGLGRHRLTVTNNNTGCITKDSTYVKLLISDVGLTKIIKPITNCGYGASMNPIVEIKNFGTDTLKTNDTIPIRLKLDGGVVQNDTLFLTSKLDPGTMVQATLSKIPLNLSVGAHTLIVLTAYPADTTKKNDTIPVSYRNFQIHGYPTVDLGPDVTIQKLSYTIRPIATSGVTSYKWSDANTTDSMVVNLSGKYVVIVANINGCETKDSINVRLKIHDLGIKRITSPLSSCSLPTTNYINVKLMNFGTDTIATSEAIDMSYRVNDTAFYSQPLYLASELRPGDSISYAFTKTVNLSSIASYKIMTKATLPGDIRMLNDSIVQIIQVFGKPHPDLPPFGNVRALKYTLDPGIGFKSYVWQDGSTDSSYVITRTHNNDPNRLYKVWVTDQNGCTAMDSTIIFFQVYDLELTKILLEDACTMKTAEDIALKITNKGYNGRVDNDISVWYKINNADSISETFKLTADDGISQIYTFNQKANLATPGTYTITAGLIFGIDLMPENNKIAQTINVYGNPSINFGTDTLRVDLPITLDAGAGSGYTYLWNTNELTQTISAPTSGSYSVKVTSSHGCDSQKEVYVKGNIADLAVSSFIIPSKNCKLTTTETVGIRISNNGNIKLTDQPLTIKYQLDGAAEKTKDVIFTGAPGDSLTYNFDGAEDLSAVKTYAFNTSLVSGIDKVATNNSKDFAVNVFGFPKINDFGATNDTVKLTTWPKVLDPGAGFATYKWQDGSNSSTFSVITKGLYKVTVTDNNGCKASDSVYILNTGIRKLSDQAEMTIYPNPVRDILNVKLNLKKDEPLVIQVLSANGKVVVTRKLSGFTQYLEQLDVYALPRGLYYIRVSTTDWVVTDKVLVE